MKTIDDVLNQPSLLRLKKAYSENKSGRGPVFFIGAGLSKEANLPDWQELSRLLEQECKTVTKTNQISESRLGPLYKKIVEETGLWERFGLIKELLGKTSFAACIKDTLSTDKKETPEIYRLLCRLECSGFVSLNIDDLLLRAMGEHYDGHVYPVYGKNASDNLQQLTRNTPYLYQPHGIITSESSWVLTADDFADLCNSPLHDEFLTSIFLRDTVLFLGINAADVGATLRLTNLINRQLIPQSHYWIVSDAHTEKRDWAERCGIQQIVYPTSLGHIEPISAIIDALAKYRPEDEIISRPVVGSQQTATRRWDISPNELFKLDDIDEIRLTLNEIIRHRSDGQDITYEEYKKICSDYKRAIHSCYMMPTGDPGEKWFGYQITGKPLGGKTMGRVIPATDNRNDSVAIKILDHRRYSDELYLSAFRRGIKALKILKDRNAIGTV